MKATLIINGKEFEVELTDEQVEQIAPKKKTGYERVEEGNPYYMEHMNGSFSFAREDGISTDEDRWVYANYYSDAEVAANNARADLLLRRLRRFAVDYRETPLDWNNANQKKFTIFYSQVHNDLSTDYANKYRQYGGIYFDTNEVALKAIDTFREELMWYFKEYKDSL